MFAVELERFRKTVQDEVQIELAHDAEIELSFAAHGVSKRLSPESRHG